MFVFFVFGAVKSHSEIAHYAEVGMQSRCSGMAVDLSAVLFMRHQLTEVNLTL